MRQLATVLAAVAALLAALPASAENALYIYNWTDYTAPDLIAKFEKETGIKVSVDTYDSNETLLAKLKSGSGGYDIIVISSDFVPIFIAERLIQKVDAARMPGFANIEARWRGPDWDKENAYTIPYHWGVTSYVVNTKFLKDTSRSLGLLFEPPLEAKGKVGMLGSASEVMSLAEAYLGLPPCQTDAAGMKQVAAVLEKQAPSVKVYSSDGIIERETTTETWIHEIWNGDAARARLNNPDLAFIFPKEGAVAWMDNMAVPSGAQNVENAKRFMAFMLKPENSAISTNFTFYSSAISGADAYFGPLQMAAPELKVPPNLKLTFTPTCPQSAIRLMDRVWTRLRR